MLDDDQPIRVINPRRLGTWEIPARRIRVADRAFKPSIALMPSGELIMTASHTRRDTSGGKEAWVELWRSKDGGMSWSDGAELPLRGHEHTLTCTSGGVLFATKGARIGRSVDAGLSWQLVDVLPGAFPSGTDVTTGNVVELADGILLVGVAAARVDEGRCAYVCESRDGGVTWLAGHQVSISSSRPYHNPDAFYDSSCTFSLSGGELVHFVRCGKGSRMFPLGDDRAVPDGGVVDRMLCCNSRDRGRTWTNLRDCGDYGMHFPRVIRLPDGRLLLTFTQRSLFHPLGLQAVLSDEDHDSWVFDHDRIVIEGKTSWQWPWTSGFGNTVQLADGTLVSCSTFVEVLQEGGHRQPLEVVQWQLPA